MVSRHAKAELLLALHIAAAERDSNLAMVRPSTTHVLRQDGWLERRAWMETCRYTIPAARYSNSVEAMRELLQACPGGATTVNDRGERLLPCTYLSIVW